MNSLDPDYPQEYQPFGRFTLPESPPASPQSSSQQANRDDPKSDSDRSTSENSDIPTPPGFNDIPPASTSNSLTSTQSAYNETERMRKISI